MTDLEILFQPIRVGDLIIKNRIEAAPSMPILALADGSVTPELVEYYRLRARGGPGLVTVGESSVDSDRAPSHLGQLRVDDDRKIRGLSRLAAAIKREGARASIELSHAGGQTIPRLLGGRLPFVPSLVVDGNRRRPAKMGRFEEMTPTMVQSVIDHFGDAAWRVQQAGFDMVMIHGGHGWLLGQFLSPLTNRRIDDYGGSLENRSRLVRQVLQRVRERCGTGLAVQLRFSADELVPGGFGPEEALRFARMIEPYTDGLHVSCGTVGTPWTSAHTHSACYLPHGRNVHLAAMVKEAVTKPVTVVGGIMDLDEAAHVLAEGRADSVAMCRALIADPFLPSKTVSGRSSEVMPCIRCNECLYRGSNWRTVRCSVNPRVGSELQYRRVSVAAVAKKVLVVGGGPAGLQAAITCATRGHEVTVWERSEQLGGNLVPASRPAFKAEMKKLLDQMIRRVDRLPVTVAMGVTADAESIREYGADAVVIAVGAEPEWPEVPGVQGPWAAWAGDVLAGRVSLGTEVVIVGGGRIGCETALMLAQLGKKVTVVEEQDALAKDLNGINRPLLVRLVLEQSVQVVTGSRMLDAVESGVLVGGPDAKARWIQADNLVLAGKMKARTTLAEGIVDVTPSLYIIGDCRTPGTLLDATSDGFKAGMDI